MTRNGEPIPLAKSVRRDGRWGERTLGNVSEPVIDEPRHAIDDEVVYLGWYFGHFGHFLTDSISRTWFLSEVDPSVKVVFHTTRSLPSGITLQILERFGISMERILVLDEPTVLRRVVIPEPLYELSVAAHERFPRECRRVMEPFVNGVQPLDQPVYLSRRLLAGDLRQIVGEFQLEEMLRENGFRIAYPETMTLDDQIRLVNQHADVFAATGSAFYSIFFASNRPRIHFLTPGIPRGDFFLAPAVTGTPSSYCNCLGLGGRVSPAISATPLMLDFSMLVDYLDEGGFLKKRLRASLATHLPELQDEFDEAWYCVSVRDVPKGETLDADIEAAALKLAGSSWPLTWVLAHYQTFHDLALVDELARQFIELVSAERDISRLARQHEDVRSMAPRVFKTCGPETGERLSAVLLERFLVDPTERRRPKDASRRSKRRRGARIKP